MQVSVTDAKEQLTDLVRRAEAGDEVVLTRHGRAAVRLVPVEKVHTAESRRAVMEAVLGSARGRGDDQTIAARSQDFLYDENGLPA